MNRINWIDWAKAIAITMVVFGHLPMEKDNYLLRYITVFHMPLFFFISGYLTKTGRPLKIQTSKYITSLVLPYFIYNILFYPYWLIRYYIENGNLLGPIYDWTANPLIGMFLLQYDSDFSCNLNGVTWFIAALILMKIILDTVTRWRVGDYLLYIIAVLCIIGYVTNEYYLYTVNLTPIGFMKCFPFYLLGYKLKKIPFMNNTNLRICSYQAALGLLVSSLAFCVSRHIHTFTINFTLFYIICIFGICFTLAFCRLLNGIHTIIIENISKGTLMIMGFHWMAIGAINYAYGMFIGKDDVAYTTLQGIMLCILIEGFIYPLICWSMKYAPILIGKDNPQGQKR